MIDNNKLKQRDGFTDKLGFTLASIGSAVGMGNIWRFPLMVSMWGGMSFLLVYVFFVFIISKTGLIEEFALGRLTNSGPVGAFSYAAKDKGKENLGKKLGFIPVLGSLSLAIGYTCVMGWIFKYVFLAINGDLSSFGSDMDLIGGTFANTASAFANNFWLIIAIISSMLIMSLGIAKGIEKANKILMPVLFILLLILAIYVGLQKNSVDAYKYIFALNFSKLKDIRLWIFAFGQAFFSLSIAGNGSVIYGSYLPKDEDIESSAANVALFDTLAALLAALVIIPAIAVSGGKLSEGGPGLMFIYLVNVFNQMAFGRIVMIVFYLAVLFAGISSIINLYEAPVAYLQEEFNFDRIKASITIHLIGLGFAILIQGIVGQWMDAVSIYVAPFGAFLAGLMFYYFLDEDKAIAEVNRGRKKPIGNWFYPLGKFIYCPLAIIAMILGIIFGGIGW